MKDFLLRLIKHPIVVNLLVAIVLTGVIVFGTLRWLDFYTLHNEAVVVPDVKGLTVDEADEFFKNNKLRYDVIDSVSSKEVAPGAIVELVPAAGSKVKEDRIVFVTINAQTSQMARIPDIQDLSFRQAYALLRSLGFTTVDIEYVAGEYKDLAVAVERDKQPLERGEFVPLNAPLTLKISSGDPYFQPDSLSLDSIPVEPINSDVENWF